MSISVSKQLLMICLKPPTISAGSPLCMAVINIFSSLTKNGLKDIFSPLDGNINSCFETVSIGKAIIFSYSWLDSLPPFFILKCYWKSHNLISATMIQLYFSNYTRPSTFNFYLISRINEIILCL